MSKRAQTDHAKALSAFINGRISRDEYKMCVAGEAWVSGRAIWKPNGMGWSGYTYSYRGSVSYRRAVTSCE